MFAFRAPAGNTEHVYSCARSTSEHCRKATSRVVRGKQIVERISSPMREVHGSGSCRRYAKRELAAQRMRSAAGSTANVHGNFASRRRKPTAARCELCGSLARCFAFPSASWQHGARVQLRVVDIGALPQGNLASRPRKAKLGRDVCIPSASWQHGARVQLRAVDIGALPQGNLASRPRKAKHGAHQFVDAWAA